MIQNSLSPDVILFRGKIHTQDHRAPIAHALAIKDGRIAAIGDDHEVKPLAGANTQLIDLDGKTAIPGITDCHFHYLDWSLGRQNLELAGVASLADLISSIRKRAEETPPGEWILGQGWNEVEWPEKRMPVKHDLDEAAMGRPVFLLRSDLHLAVVNSVVLELSGIKKETPNPPEGIIDRDSTGEPNGILRDLAINLVRPHVPEPTHARICMAMADGFQALHKLGITGIHDMRLMGGLEGEAAFRAWQHLSLSGDLNIRCWMALPSERLHEIKTLGLCSGFGDDKLKVGHLKFFSDGGMGARTAWLLEPYLDADAGIPLTPVAQIRDSMELARKYGLASTVHAIGDRAIHELLTAMAELEKTAGKNPGGTFSAPVFDRMEHVQMIQSRDIPLMAELGVVASVQPIHLADDMPMVEEAVGARGRRVYRFLDLMKAGVMMIFGSDCPVANPNPMWSIHAAVTRKRRDLTPNKGWYPDQRMDVEAAVRCFTLNPAIACGLEKELGTVSCGKRADLTVLDTDIFSCEPDEIKDAKPVLTLFDGKVAFRNY